MSDIISKQLAAVHDIVREIYMNDMSSRAAMTVAEFADALCISQRQVYRLIETGDVKSFRVGRAVRIPTGEVERYINTHMVATNEEA